MCFEPAPQEFRSDDGEIEIDIVGDDGGRLLHIVIELREHLVQRHAFSFCPLGRDAMNSRRVHRNREIRRVNDETVPAFPVAIGIVERPGKLDDPGPFFEGVVCCGVLGEAGGFGVEEEEHLVYCGGDYIWVYLI